jgi:hypothetical protein
MAYYIYDDCEDTGNIYDDDCILIISSEDVYEIDYEISELNLIEYIL